MNKKSNMKKSLLSGIASVVKKNAEFNADTFCMWWNYQPKKPAAIKKMRKF